MKEIQISELKQVVNRLLDHAIETRGVSTVRLENNYYWDVPSDSLYDVEGNAPELVVGSLEDDWQFVQGLLNADKEPVAIQLTEVAPILRYVGEELGRILAKQGG